jgi:hypothetical protein
MTIKFASPDRAQQREVYTLSREPVVGEHVEVWWEEPGEGDERSKTKGFRGEVEEVHWRFGEKSADHTVMVLLK